MRADRNAAQLPSDAVCRPARRTRPRQPVGPRHRARRSLHRRVRPLGRAHLPRRIRGRRTPRSFQTGIRDYVEQLAAPISPARRNGTRQSASASPAATIDAMVKRHLGDPFFNVALNPGHLIHLDEWMNTPIYPGSEEKLQSATPSSSTSSRRRARPISPPTSRTASASSTKRGREEFCRALSRCVATDRAPPRLHGGHPWYQAEAGSPAVQQPRRHPAALPPVPAAGAGAAGLNECSK